MTIRFHCEACHKTVEAPDSAAGRRGKCPYCGHSGYIASSVREEDLIPLKPIDEQGTDDAAADSEQIKHLEKELLHEMSGEPSLPLDQKEDLTSEDLHHLVVNYCLDMFHGNCERAERVVDQLKQFKFTAVQAVNDFRSGKADEPVMKAIPPKLRKGFLEALSQKLK